MSKPRPATFLVLLGSLLASACGDEAEPAAKAGQSDAPPVVVTTFYPTEYLTRRLADELVSVRCDVPADADALFWMPSDEEVLAYQEADLVILNGAGLESWLDKVSLPPSRLVDTSEPYAQDLIEFEALTHSHGGGEHSHHGLDPHTWLDPRYLILQAGEIHAALVRLLPEHEAELDARWSKLRDELEELDASYAALGELPEGQHLYANHPAYNYLVRRYGWPIVNLDLDPETLPDEQDLEHVAAELGERSGRFLLWESQPRPEIARRFEEELGLASLVVRPAELLAPEERAAGTDLLSILRANREALAPAFAP